MAIITELALNCRSTGSESRKNIHVGHCVFLLGKGLVPHSSVIQMRFILAIHAFDLCLGKRNVSCIYVDPNPVKRITSRKSSELCAILAKLDIYQIVFCVVSLSVF